MTATQNTSLGKFKDVSDTDVLSANRVNEDDEFQSPERLDSNHDQIIAKKDAKNQLG